MRKPLSAFLMPFYVLCVLSLSSLAARAQERDRGEEHEHEHPNGLVQDWSNHHVVYPRVGPIQALIAAQNNPRAQHEWQESIRKDWRRYYRRHEFHRAKSGFHTDWSISLGGGSTGQNQYPAKFSFNPNDAANCATDFVVFPVNIVGTPTQANLVGFNNLYSGTVPVAGLCNRTPNPGVDDGVSATTMFAYNVTAAIGIIATSPTLSEDGTKIAVVETGGGAAHFHVLAWKAGDGVNSNLQNATGSPVSLNGGFPTLAPAAGSGTMTSLAIGSANDSNSSPFVDYVNDTAYVGNDAGVLFRIKNVFCTVACTVGVTAAPSLDATWNGTGSVDTGCGGVLTGAVVADNGNVFVGCSNGRLYGFTSAGVPLGTPSVVVGDGSATGGIADTPILDTINGLIYAVSGNSGGGTQVIVQASATDLGSIVTATLATGGSHSLHAPALNDAYYTSLVPANWMLYEVVPDSVAHGIALYGVGFSGAHVMNSGTPTNKDPFAVGSALEISPLTEFLTAGGEDRLFESALDPTGGSVASYRIDLGFPADVERVNSTASVGNGATGIIVDNSSASAQADSIYFSALGANTAVKLTQSGLQ